MNLPEDPKARFSEIIDKSIADKKASDAKALEIKAAKEREQVDLEQSIGSAVQSLLDFIGVDEALDQINNKVLAGKGTISFFNKKQDKHVILGGGSSIGASPVSSYDIGIFCSGYWLHGESKYAPGWNINYYPNNIFIGFVGGLKYESGSEYPNKRDPRLLDSFGVAGTSPDFINGATRYAFINSYRGYYLPYPRQPERIEQIADVVDFLSPTNVELARIMQDGISKKLPLVIRNL